MLQGEWPWPKLSFAFLSCVCEKRRLWRDCDYAQAHLSLPFLLHADVSYATRGLDFVLSLHLFLYFVNVSGEDKTTHNHRLI